MIQVKRAGARPYRMCINHRCVTKADWVKKGVKTTDGTEVKPKKRPASKKKTAAKKKPAKKSKK